MKAFKVTLILTTCTLLATSASAASISPGNLLIYRVGDGSAALAAATTAVFIDEYTPLGTLVQSIPLPTTGAGVCTALGNATTEGVLSVANNGLPNASVIFTGYQTAAGASGTPGTAVPRVIGTIGLAGLANTTSYAVTDSGSTAVRSAASTDGSSLFYLGTASGVRYVGSPGPAATSSLIDSRNSRQVLLTGNRLRASNGSTAVTAKVQDYGVMPTGSTTPSAIVTLTSSDAVHGIAFFDLSTTVAGVDTVYALSTVAGQLVKWTYDGTTWSANGTITGTGSTANLTGYADASGVQLYLTSPSALYSLFDASGYAANITGSLTTLAAAGNNTAFRGISVIPEPSTFCLALAGLATLLVARRRS